MSTIFPLKTLTVVATVQARPGKEDELRKALMEITKSTRKERGCLQYDVHQLMEDSGRFMIFQTWQDQATFDAHMKNPHVIALLPRLNELCTAFPHVTIWQKI